MKKDSDIKYKKYYDVKVEVMLPATITYRVYAQDEQEAITLIKNANPQNVKYRLNGKKELKLAVYDAGSTMIRFVKSFLGG